MAGLFLRGSCGGLRTKSRLSSPRKNHPRLQYAPGFLCAHLFPTTSYPLQLHLLIVSTRKQINNVSFIRTADTEERCDTQGCTVTFEYRSRVTGAVSASPQGCWLLEGHNPLPYCFYHKHHIESNMQ